MTLSQYSPILRAGHHERAERALTAYYAAGGVRNHRFNDDLLEDVDVDAKVMCILRADHPGSREDEDNIVAELNASMLLIEAWEEGFSFSEFGGAGKLPPLVDVRLCWLFHDLVDHVLHRDWDRVLDIGGVWIDVNLMQQRIVSW